MDPNETPPSSASPESAPTDTTQETPAVVEEKSSPTAKFLFDEPNPVFADVEQSVAEENIHAGHEEEDLAKLAASAQNPPPINTAISEEQGATAIAAVTPPVLRLRSRPAGILPLRLRRQRKLPTRWH